MTERGYADPVELGRLVADAQAVVDAVQMDDSGRLVGQIFMGGNGGLLSKDTLRAVDKLRLTIATIKSADWKREQEKAK